MPLPLFPLEVSAASFFAAEVVGFDAAEAPSAAGAPGGADFVLSFVGGRLEVFAALSAAAGAVIAARVLTSNFKSTGVLTPEFRSISLVAGAKPSCEISMR
jgi:hypothetical protein